MHYWQVLFRLNRIQKMDTTMKHRLINSKAFQEEDGFHPPRPFHAGGASLFFLTSLLKMNSIQVQVY